MWVYIVVIWLCFYLITHIVGLTLVHIGVWGHITPRDIYVCTEHSRVVSFIIWLIELIICPFVVITCDIVIIFKWAKWKKEEYRRYH